MFQLSSTVFHRSGSHGFRTWGFHSGCQKQFLGLATIPVAFSFREKAKQSAPVIWTYLQWNPVLQIIDSLRQVIFGEGNQIGFPWVMHGFLVFSYYFLELGFHR